MLGNLKEIELKLAISPVDISRLKRHKAIKESLISKSRPRRLVSIYYDTPDLQLLDTGLSLRIRRMSGNWFQSIKTTGTVKNGLHTRLEWEDLLKTGKPNFNKITDPKLINIFSNQDLCDSLKPIFTTDVKRTEWLLETSDGLIELAIDVGILHIENEKKADICELELELKSGSSEQLFVLAEKIKSSINLKPENSSKAEIGYSLYKN